VELAPGLGATAWAGATAIPKTKTVSEPLTAATARSEVRRTFFIVEPSQEEMEVCPTSGMDCPMTNGEPSPRVTR